MSSPLRAPATSLRLTAELVEKIRSLSFEGFKSLPRRGAEIGGLITADPSTLSLADEVRIVESEHFFGPSYQLSDRDLLRLHNAAGECRKAGRCIIAYFRSSTRPNDEVDAHDRRAIADVFPETAFVVIARPANNGSARIRIYRAEGNDRWSVFQEFDTLASPKPGPASKPAKMQPQEALRALGNNAAPAGSSYPQTPDAKGGDNGEDRDRAPWGAISQQPRWRAGLTNRRLIAAALGVAGVVILGAVIVETRSGSRRHPEDVPPESRVSRQSPIQAAHPSGGLGLAVRPEVRQLHLTWNRDSPAVKTATFGLLQILDGAAPVSIELASSDLTEGSFIYTPHSRDVTFRLRLGTVSGQNAEEAIRVFGATPLESAESPADAAGALTPPREREAVINPRARPAISNPSPVRAPSRKLPPRPTPPATPPRTAARPKTSPHVAQLQATQSRAAQSGPPQATAHQNSPPVSRETDAIRPAQPTAPPTPETSRVASIPPSRETFLPAASAPATAPSDGPAVAYPIPLRQVQPSLSTVHWTVAETTRIAILVSVNPKGTVTDARAELASKGKSMFLEGLCLNAARQWTFKPAMINGQPVEGKYRIEFVFQPR